MSDGEDPSVQPAAPNPQVIMHVDMDAFFAAVEVLDDPSLAGRPVVVGGTGPRGVVAACTYEARAYGIRSAMPTGQARRLCPHAVFVAGRHARYAAVSRRLHQVFETFTPLVEGVSLDEAFLDVTGAQRLFGPPEAIAGRLRSEVHRELGLRCSVGVSSVKFLAKLASVAAKPRATLAGVLRGPGVVVVSPGEELAFLHPMAIESLWGVGPATATRLRRRGVTTVGELAQVPLAALEVTLGRSHGRHLHQLAWGKDPRRVEPDRDVKSISQEETYPRDRADRDGLRREVLKMADAVATRSRRAGLAGRTVTLKVRFGDFTTLTRSRTVSAGLESAAGLVELGCDLLDGVETGRGVRLLGLAVSNLVPASGHGGEQLALELGLGGAVGTALVRSLPVGEAVEAVRQRFGDAAIGPAALLGPDGLRLRRRGDAAWGPQLPDGADKLAGPEPTALL